MVLTLLLLVLLLPLFDSTLGAQPNCSAAYLSICFHKLLNVGSMRTFKLVINLATGQGQFRHPLHNCLES